MLKSRSTEAEIIDIGPSCYELEEYEDFLLKLGHIGRWLGGDRATLQPLYKMIDPPKSILDVGCGGGFFTTRLARQYPHAKVVGIDLNTAAIEFAMRRLSSLRNPPKNLIFETRNCEQLVEPSKSYDVVMSTLVCHHLSDDTIVDFILRASQVAKKKIIINDLHRHPMALHLFRAISPIFFPNRLIKHDGLISIRKGFTREDLVNLLNQTALKPSQYAIHWRWAFRWVIEINCAA